MLPLEGFEYAYRRERPSIAAQACQSCRNRKSKCDEQRPQCSTCRRLNIACEYREPLPTKKDKTMIQILDTLVRLENKFDNLALTGGGVNISSSDDTPPTNASSIGTASPSQILGPGNLPQDLNRSSFIQQVLRTDSATRSRQSSDHITVIHKILLWPGVYLHLVHTGNPVIKDLQYILQEGTAWFIRQEILKNPTPLPANIGLPSFAFQSSSQDPNQNSRIALPTLTIQQIQEYTEVYFNTFNVLFPLLNRDTFMNDIVARLLREGYGNEDAESVLALLVFALGRVAVAGLYDQPISTVNGHPSGFRGGTTELPPGIEIFNEARRRYGFIATQTSLENVQVRLLLAIYHESHGRYMDFWHATISASMTCQVLIKCQHIDWSSTNGDLIKRAYWTCVLSEDICHCDLDLPQSGIQELEDSVPLPNFHASNVITEQPRANDERAHFQHHFLAMIALRRLINRIRDAIHNSSSDQPEVAEGYMGPPVTVISEMSRQLDSWRALLPRPLQWSDQDRFDFPPHMSNTSQQSNEPLFAADQGPLPIFHRYNLDIVTAQLRTRFYQARFIMYRPFIYKALHFPELMTAEDANYCALAIKSACMWPLAMAPPKNKKRLVPHLFAWTQNFLSILLIFRMTVENECLRRVCEEHVDRVEIENSAALMLDWIRDAKQVDGIAEWSWKLLEPLYMPRSN